MINEGQLYRDDEQDRHRCEVRYLLLIGQFGAGEGKDAISQIAKARGQVAADRLAEEARDQWRKGNRGAAGDWR